MEIIINNKYKIIENIGEGSFGTIFKGQNIRTLEYVAIKVESIENELKFLKNESKIYQYLKNSLGVPSVKWFGKDDRYYYMVINLLGKSLQNIKNEMGVFSLKRVLEIGIKLVSLLNMIHDKGLIHRDIKPDNFLYDTNNDGESIYIIDFGFCKSYIINNNHIKEKKTKSLIGSQTYASINSHNCNELSRRDDLESLGYMLIYFYLGSFPWQNNFQCKNSLAANFKENLNEKIKLLKEKIIYDNSLPEVLLNYMKYVRSLDFEEAPNYELIINSFRREIVKNT
jgi:casein kinase I family protein HRR25